MSEVESYRFLFVDDNGVEVKVPSVYRLAELFRAGAIGEQTLVFDAETREWAPARTHPVCEFMLETSGGAAGPDPAPDTHGLLSDLQFIPDEGEDIVGSFLEAREKEREEDRRENPSIDGTLELVSPAAESLGYPLQPVPEVRESRARAHAPVGPTTPDGLPSGGAVAPGSAPAPSTRRPRRRRLHRATGAAASLRRQALLLALLSVVGGWGIADAWSAPLPPPSLEEAMIASTLPRPAGSLPTVPVRLVPEDALAQMAVSMEALRSSMRLGEPPAVWMAGPYLADAGAYPEVERYWELYGTFVERLREEEESFYRAGLEEQLERQRVSGAAQDIRIARAMEDFRADADRREAHYAAMEGLSRASLGLHDFLLANAGAVLYEPVEQGVTRDPILEVGVQDPATRAELELRVDRLLEALDAVAGPDPERRRDVTRHVLGRIGAGPAPAAD